ncbi:MAG: hypothetical protein NUV32_10195 [Exilispira sp.]|jgi:3-deoxy-D-manno-octulosonic-acid transferase|nr:hypothetical protein [Exilispira sp.]
MKRQKLRIFHSFFLFLLFLLSIFIIPIFLMIDILFNIKRSDKKRYFNERFNLFYIFKKISNYKNSICNKNSPFIICVATSAGEISTVETLFESNNVNLLIFTTSITGRDKNLNLNYSQIFYLPLPNIFYLTLIFSMSKPDSIIFLEHEFWPSYFIASFLLNISIITLQIRPSLLKSKLSSIFYINLLRLSNIIFLTESKEKYPDNFPFYKVKLDNVDIKTLKMAEEKVSNLKNSVIFASTHEEEEDIFFDSIKFLKDNLLNTKDCLDFLIFLAPRHPNRSKEIHENAIKKGIKSVFYSSIKDEIKIFFSNLESSFENQNQNINKSYYELINNIKTKELEDLNHSKISKDEPFIIIVNEFGVLDYLYKYSKVAIVGATFAELGGGHNIYEPLLKECFVIVGPYLHNMLNIFKNAEKLNLTFRVNSEFKELSEKIYHAWVISTQYQNKKGNPDFSDSPFEKLYLSQSSFKQHILDEILKVSGNS